MDPNLLRTSRLVCLALVLGISTTVESSFLSHNKSTVFGFHG